MQTLRRPDISRHTRGVGPTRRALLLDVDGVLIGKVRDSSPIVRNIVSHIAKHLSLTHVKSETLNDDLYKCFGHTWAGLRCRFPERYHCSLQQFNDEVYDTSVLNMKLHFSDQHKIDVQRLVMNCHLFNVPVATFSNAPVIWCTKVAHTLGISESIHYCAVEEAVKPQWKAYETAEERIKKFDKRISQLIFVDDALKNIDAVFAPRSVWCPILYGHDSESFSRSGGHSVRSFSELNNMLWSE